MSRLKKNLIKIFILLVAICSFAVAKNVSAAEIGSVYTEIILNMMKKCYSPLSISTEIDLVEYRKGSSAKDSFLEYVLNGGGSGQQIIVPTQVGTGIPAVEKAYTTVTCPQLFLGDDASFAGIYGMSGKALPDPASSNLGDELGNIGYSESEGGGSTQKCIVGKYQETGMSAESDAGMVCWEEGEYESEADFIDSAILTGGTNGTSLAITSVTYGRPAVTKNYVQFTDPDGNTCRFGGSKRIHGFDDIDGFAGETCKTSKYTVTASVDSAVKVGTEYGKRKMKSTPGQAYTDYARKYFGGSGDLHVFSDDEKYTLYYAYLKEVYGMEDMGESCKTRDWVKNHGGAIQDDGSYYIYEAGGYKRYQFPLAKKDLGVSVFGGDDSFLTGWGSLDTVVQDIFNLTGNFASFPETGSCEEGSGDGGGGGSGSVGDPTLTPGGDYSLVSGEVVDCNQFTNVGAMQWVLCPVMNNEQYTASWIDNMTQKWLQVKPSTYTNSNVVTVWENIRNIANVLMIVFLLVVILSQVTGYGIDNYGIKKMLPRLIMMAIIINLSLYICQMAIDLSNIAGVGLRNMFSSIGMAANPHAAGDPSFLGGAITGIFAAASSATGAAAATAGILFTVGAPIVVAVIIMVVVILATILIAVMVLFLMLGAREIIVVLCVVLSPLAFAAFILPNTQNLFKKWWELFKAAIIIFPICGAMAGISNMFRYALYDKTANHYVWEYVILMILPYLGFFLIPMLLKNAISALGKVGGALTALGNTVRNGGKAIGQQALRAGQNTQAFKNAKEQAERQRNERNAQRAIDRVRRREQSGRTISDADRRRVYDAQMTLNKMQQERYLAEEGAPVISDEMAKGRAQSIKKAQELKNYSDQFDVLSREQMATELERASADYGRDRTAENGLKLQAALVAANKQGMNQEIYKYLGDMKFNAVANSEDANVLSALGGVSTDKVISQFGIQMNKVDKNTNQKRSVDTSINDFIGAAPGDFGLRKNVIGAKGSNVLNDENDDTWGQIFDVMEKKGDYSMIDTHSLVNGVLNAKDDKVLDKIKEIFTKRKEAGVQEDYSMGVAELAKLKPAAAAMLENTGIYDGAVASILANPNSSANQQILNAMDNSVKAQVGLDNNTLMQALNMQPGYFGKTGDDLVGEAMKENAERANNPETRMRDLSLQSAQSLQNKVQSGEINRQMAHQMLTTGNKDVQRRIDTNGTRRILEAAASGMMPTASNPTPNIPGGGQLNWNNSADVDRAAFNYREQAKNMNGSDYSVKDAAQVIDEAMAENTQRKAEDDRVAAQQAEAQQRVEQTNAFNRLADSIDRFAGNKQGPVVGAGIGSGYVKGQNGIWLPGNSGQNGQKPNDDPNSGPQGPTK